MSHPLTASKLPLADHCLAWLHLPWVDHGADAERATGNAFDDLVAGRILRGSPSFRRDYSEETREQAWALYGAWCERFEPLIDEAWAAQVAYAVTFPAEPRRLGIEIDRAYPGDAHLAGSADMVTFFRDDMGGLCLTIRDTKTGQQSSTRSRGVAHNRQLRALAWMAWRSSPSGIFASRIVVALDYVSPSGVISDEHTFYPTDMGEIGAELRDLWEDAQDPTSPPAPGLHCEEMFCPAFASCPAQRARAESAAPDDVRRLPVLAEPTALADAQKARMVYDALRAIDGQSARWWKLLDAWVDQNGPIPLDGGAVYAAMERRDESIEYGPGAMGVLLAHLGERASGVPKFTLTKKAIGEASRAVAGQGKGGASLERVILAGLREAGVVRERTTVVHQVTKRGSAR